MLKVENDWKFNRNDINNFFTVFRIYTNIFRIFRHLVGSGNIKKSVHFPKEIYNEL
jgi:hypothetical protein